MSPTSTITATHERDIAANTTTNIHADFAGGDNAAGTVSASATITYVGISTPAVINLGPLARGRAASTCPPPDRRRLRPTSPGRRGARLLFSGRRE